MERYKEPGERMTDVRKHVESTAASWAKALRTLLKEKEEI